MTVCVGAICLGWSELIVVYSGILQAHRQLGIDRGGGVYTTEIGKHQKPGLFFSLESWFTSTPVLSCPVRALPTHQAGQGIPDSHDTSSYKAGNAHSPALCPEEQVLPISH